MYDFIDFIKHNGLLSKFVHLMDSVAARKLTLAIIGDLHYLECAAEKIFYNKKNPAKKYQTGKLKILNKK